MIKFHLDENANTAIADGLRRRGIDVTTTLEAGLISASEDMLQILKNIAKIMSKSARGNES